MNAPRTLLAATDFSDPARHAAERAARLAHETGAALTLMHVQAAAPLQVLRQWLGQGHAAEAHLQAEAEQQLQALATKLQTAHKVPVRTVSSTGPVLDELLREAAEQQVSLLVLGVRGIGFVRRLALGSTSERLLRRTQLPLLVVRQTPHQAYRRALVAVDFSAWSVQSLALVRQVAPHAHIVLTSVYQVPFEEKLRFAGVDLATVDHYRELARADAMQRVHELARSAGLKPGHWEPCVVEGEAWQRLIELEQARDCDLVVLGKHGQSVTEDLLLGSVTQRVLAEGDTDVLVSTAHA